MIKEVIIYTDGACSGNPGPGGWGAVLIFGDNIKEISGYSSETTNNIMELTAAIESLKLIKQTCSIKIYTDSVYVKNGMTVWINNWKKNGWRTANKKLVKNMQIWIELDMLCKQHAVSWFWIKGHSDNYYNNRADFLAVQAVKNNQ